VRLAAVSLHTLVLGSALLAVGCLRRTRPEAEEVARACRRIEGSSPIELPRGPGRIELSPSQSLTIERLRGVELDARPPVPRGPAPVYDPRMTDGFPPGQAPYVARGIRPFRFRWFTNEFNYGGWHNFAMFDYALAHGFSVLFPYNSKPADWAHAPSGTRFLKWGGFVNWEKWLPKHGIPAGRYDRLAGLDAAELLEKEGVFKPGPGYDSLMIDLEHPLLKPDQLRKQPWYPAAAPAAERRAFEKRYCDGYATTYIAPIQVARRAGWRDISLYGWQPFARTYFGLEKVALDPATDWAWNAFGKAIYGAVDILNPSVYCFYWTPKNVAYTLANIDLNMKLVATMPVKKPVRPYYWTLLHGGGAGNRWWRGQPLPNEDVRAMTALAFFTGIDGIVLWNWSGTGNHHAPEVEAGADVMVGRPFDAQPVRGGAARSFHRYDALHILRVADDGLAHFQLIEKTNAAGNYGVRDDRPVYAVPARELVAHLRPASEPVAAMIEGLALVKPFEHMLRHGEVKIDVSAQKQFGDELPIVRRVKLGRYHLLATYDPGWMTGQPPRKIVLDDFDGRRGLKLVLPADAETRLFLLRE